MKDPGLTGYSQPARQEALRGQAARYGRAHRLPDFAQEFPNLVAFALRHVFPEGLAGLGAMREQLGEGVEGVDDLQRARFLISQRAASQAVHLPGVGDCAIRKDSPEPHAVGVQRKFPVRAPDQLHRHGGESLLQRGVGHVSLARGGQAAVKRDPIAHGIGIARPEPGGCALRRHGVAAGWAVPDPVELTQ